MTSGGNNTCCFDSSSSGGSEDGNCGSSSGGKYVSSSTISGGKDVGNCGGSVISVCSGDVDRMRKSVGSDDEGGVSSSSSWSTGDGSGVSGRHGGHASGGVGVGVTEPDDCLLSSDPPRGKYLSREVVSMSTCTPSVVDQRFNRRGDSPLGLTMRLWRLNEGEALVSSENLFLVPMGECS